MSIVIVYCKVCGDPMLTQKENKDKEFICRYCCSSNQYSKQKHRAIIQEQGDQKQ